MLGIGPKLWETIHRRYYRYNPSSPPFSRAKVARLRDEMPARADGKPRCPASGEYYEAIDKLTAASHSPNPSTQVSDR